MVLRADLGHITLIDTDKNEVYFKTIGVTLPMTPQGKGGHRSITIFPEQLGKSFVVPEGALAACPELSVDSFDIESSSKYMTAACYRAALLTCWMVVSLMTHLAEVGNTCITNKRGGNMFS